MLVASILGSGIVLLDGTVVNVALPAIRSDLGAGLAGQQWVVEAYLLTLSSLLLIGGSLGDRLGRRRIFVAGVSGFGICSALCAAAPTTGVLIAARAAQGLAGALLVPSSLALIMDTFDESGRSAAIGRWTAWGGLAAVIGPLGGGLLVQAVSWRLIFAINLLPVATTIWLLRRVPAGDREAGHVDVTGAVLAATGLGATVFALIEQPTHGWGKAIVTVPMAAGIVLLVAFVAWEARAREPMMPLELFRSQTFSAGNLTTFSLYGGLGVATFLLVLYLQQVGGYRPVEAGLALMPITVLMFTLSRRFGALADRFGPRPFMSGGPILAGVGLILVGRTGATADYTSEVLPGVLVFGLGLTATVAPLTATVLSAVEPGHSGVASGINNAVARVAGLIAIAAVGAVLASAFAARLEHDVAHRPLSPRARAVLARARSRPLVVDVSAAPPGERRMLRAVLVDASEHGFRRGMLISGALAILGGLISGFGIGGRRREVPCADYPMGALVAVSERSASAAGEHR